jgi:hypothetical protein
MTVPATPMKISAAKLTAYSLSLLGRNRQTKPASASLLTPPLSRTRRRRPSLVSSDTIVTARDPYPLWPVPTLSLLGSAPRATMVAS